MATARHILQALLFISFFKNIFKIFFLQPTVN